MATRTTVSQHCIVECEQARDPAPFQQSVSLWPSALPSLHLFHCRFEAWESEVAQVDEENKADAQASDAMAR